MHHRLEICCWRCCKAEENWLGMPEFTEQLNLKGAHVPFGIHIRKRRPWLDSSMSSLSIGRGPMAFFPNFFKGI